MIPEKAAGNGRRELTVRVPDELYERLREAVYKLRISQNQALTEALEMWLEEAGEAVTVWEFAIARKAFQLMCRVEPLTPDEQRTLDVCRQHIKLLEIREGRREMSKRLTAR